jgi:hypothetical protein
VYQPIDIDRLTTLAKDAAYVSVGFGVLAVQKAQVRRNELTTSAKERLVAARQLLEANAGQVDARLAQLDAVVDGLVDKVAARLPEPANTVVHQAYDVTKAGRNQLRQLILA